ncbi:MAG: hypothetical protein AAGA56_09620, partial [Myxococcota bacterium]
MDRLARIFFDNFWLKLVALTFSLGFYGLIHSEQNATRSFEVKILAKEPPEGTNKKLMTAIPPSVDIKLVGPRQQLDGMRGDDLSITLDLSGAQNVDLRFSADMINGLPPRLTVDRFIPPGLD